MTTRLPSSPAVDDVWIDAESADAEPAQIKPTPPPAPVKKDALIGTTLLDTYRVERVMGEGGMGRIYEARHVRIALRRFAIKVLRPELVSSAHIRARFEREVEAVARVTHPGVLTIADVGISPQGLPFMVCEHLSGLDLLAYTRRFRALPNDRVVHMGCRIAEALEAAHAQGVIHRDIKPSNIFLLGAFEPLGPEWDRVKVIDFGLSRLVGRDDYLTETGLVMGTPAYMSPEQARAVQTDHRTDVYGLGAVMYAAATGDPPFREETPQQTLIAVMSRDPVRPRARNPAISEELELVIQRAMAKQPEDRYPSMSALRLALSDLELAITSRASGARRQPQTGGIGRVRLRFIALASAAALLFAAATVSAVVGFVPLGNIDVPLSVIERVALLGILLVALGLVGRWLRHFGKRTWSNTAKLADRLPRLRAPVLWALSVYALASFAVRFGDDVLPRFAVELDMAHPSRTWPGWGALLAIAALCTALIVVLHQSWWRPMRPVRRWVWGPIIATAVVLSCLGLGRWAALAPLEQRLEHTPAEPSATFVPTDRAAAATAPGAGAASPGVGTASDDGARTAATPTARIDAGPFVPVITAAELPEDVRPLSVTDPSPMVPTDPNGTDPNGTDPMRTGSGATEPSADHRNATHSSLTELTATPPGAAAPSAARPGANGPEVAADTAAPHAGSSDGPPAAPSPANAHPASDSPGANGALGVATSGAPASPGLAPVPGTASSAVHAPAPGGAPAASPPSWDPRETMKAEVFAHAQNRAGTLDLVRAIEGLLLAFPETATDPDVHRALIRAAASGGAASRAALNLMSTSMGSAGPDLLYQLMVERPSLAEQTKYLLSRTRVRKLFSPELAIAYDLRFSPSCGARLGLLDRASDIGDQRSINTLASLLSNSPRCGQPGRFPCVELCERESPQFTKAIDTMVRRLRGSERAASMN